MKAIALFSGGLDSTLAIKLIRDQGIEVLAINISTGFGSTKDRREHMQNMCEQVGAEFRIVDIQSEYLQDVLFDPKHGYGKNFNPCIDCHAKMFAVAKRIMEAEGASFLISGVCCRHIWLMTMILAPESRQQLDKVYDQGFF